MPQTHFCALAYRSEDRKEESPGTAPVVILVLKKSLHEFPIRIQIGQS
jgi:hypothetical protein